MGLGYNVQVSAINTPGGSGTTVASNALASALTGGNTVVAVVQANNAAVPTGVALDNGDTLTKIAQNADGYVSIWAKASCTAAAAGAIATATWAGSVSGRSITVAEYASMPAALNVIDTGSASIASGVLNQIAGVTNMPGNLPSIVLIAGQTVGNQTATRIHENLSLHEYRRLSGDATNHFYDHVAVNAVFNVTVDADYPNTSSDKRLVIAVIEAGDPTDTLALVAANTGAPHLSSGSINGSGDDCGGLAMGGLINEIAASDFGWSTRFTALGYIDRLHCLVVENSTAILPARFSLRHEGGPTLNAWVDVPVGELGWFPCETGQIDVVPAGSYVRGHLSAEAALRVAGVAYRYTCADGVSTITVMIANGSMSLDASVPYFGITGQLVASAGVTDPEYRIGGACIAANIVVHVRDNTRTSTTSIYLNVNGSDTALKVDIEAGAATVYRVSTPGLQVTIADLDKLAYHLVLGAGVGDFGIRSIQVDLITTDRSFFGGLGQQGRAPGTPVQMPMSGVNNALSGGYAEDALIVSAFTLTKLDIHILAPAHDDAALEVYRDGVASGFAVAIPAAFVSDWAEITGALAMSADDATFTQAYVYLTKTGTTFPNYAGITWAATLLDLSPPARGIIGELAWIHRTRQLPEDGSLAIETYSDEDMQCPGSDPTYQNGYKEALVVDFGEAERTASDPVTGQWRASTCTVRYQRGRYFREQSLDPVNRYILSGQALMTTRANRAVLGEPYTVLVGALVKAQPGPELTWDETYGDFIAYGKRANQRDVLPWRVLGDSFVVAEMTVIADGLDLLTPEPTHYGRLIRVPEVDGASEQGFVFPPIYLGIETIDGIDKHSWMISGHANAAIVNLRVDLTEVFTDPEWEIPGIGGFPKYEDRRSPTFGNLRRYAILRAPVTDLAAAEEDLTNPDACALGVKTLTVALEGVEPNGDGSGDVITDRLLQYLHYEQNFGQRKGQDGYQAGDWLATPTWNVFGGTTPMIDEASYAACSAIALERLPATGSPPVGGYIGAWSIGARPGDRRSRADWKAGWNRSCSTRSGPTNLGADRVFMLHPTQAIKDAAELYAASTEILRNSFAADLAWDQQQTRVTFFCDPLPATGQWQTTDTITNDAIAVYGDADIPGDPRYYDAAPGITQASHLAIIESRRLANPPRPVAFAAKVPPNADGTSLGYAQVGDYYRYQDHEGINTSPDEIRLMQVESVRISPSRRSVLVKGYDVDDLIGYDEPDEAAESVSPLNETCTDALEFDGAPDTPFTITLDTSGNATDGSVAGGSPAIVLDQAYHAAWFKVVPDSTGRLFATTVSSDYDTQMAILTGTCGASPMDWTLEDYNDNDGFLKTSVLDIPVVGGTTYYILVAGVGPEDGGRLVFGAQCYVP